jgi:cytochrome c6
MNRTPKHAALFSMFAALALVPAVARGADPATEPRAPGAVLDEALWEAKCSKCHGLDGKGHTKTGARYKIDDFTSAKWQKEMDDKEIRKTIEEGVKSKKGKVKMPAFKGKLSDDQIAALVAYVRSFGK